MKYFKNAFYIFICICLSFSLYGCCNNHVNNLKNNLIIHYIDVGQGDSELIQYKNINILIDAGTQKNCDKLIKYLKKQNVKTLNYIIATHPHEDHIGGLPKVIKTFKVNEFYAPKVTTNTKSFKDMVKELKNKNMKIKVGKDGVVLTLSKECSLNFLSPIKSEYNNLNNYSIVAKLNFKNLNFLFTGDAEKEAENDMLSKNQNLNCEILKLGHHGSKSSSTEDFLNKTNPKIAIISCGYNNDYKHPHKETLKKLEERFVKIYRTDIDGTIVFYSDGVNIYKK